MEEIVVLIQLGLVALLAWGAWLCISGRDRRKTEARPANTAWNRRKSDVRSDIHVIPMRTSRAKAPQAAERVTKEAA
jgi:hypothetical protein